jgi:hypothetical protein
LSWYLGKRVNTECGKSRQGLCRRWSGVLDDLGSWLLTSGLEDMSPMVLKSFVHRVTCSGQGLTCEHPAGLLWQRDSRWLPAFATWYSQAVCLFITHCSFDVKGLLLFQMLPVGSPLGPNLHLGKATLLHLLPCLAGPHCGYFPVPRPQSCLPCLTVPKSTE